MKTLDPNKLSHLPPISNIYDVPEWWKMTRMPLSRYTPIGGKAGNLMISPSDEQLSTALCFPSMQAATCPPLRTFSTSTAATGQTGAPHRSDRSGAVVDPPILRTWLSAQPRNLQWFFGEPLVKPHRRRLDLHAKLQATSLSLLLHGPPTRSCLVP